VRLGGGGVLVHCAASNVGFTRDGVAAGGKRLAAEVLRIRAAHPSLESLSLVGNSLGGLVRLSIALQPSARSVRFECRHSLTDTSNGVLTAGHL